MLYHCGIPSWWLYLVTVYFYIQFFKCAQTDKGQHTISPTAINGGECPVKGPQICMSAFCRWCSSICFVRLRPSACTGALNNQVHSLTVKPETMVLCQKKLRSQCNVNSQIYAASRVMQVFPMTTVVKMWPWRENFVFTFSRSWALSRYWKDDITDIRCWS